MSNDIPESPFGCRYPLEGGFICLMDVMGSDSSIVNAARVSVKSGESYNDTRARTEADDAGLIRYLMSHGHTSPFEMAEVVFLVQAPIFVTRQWFRHRTWSYNEISGRYTDLPETTMYVPESATVCHKSKSIKQGRGRKCSPEITEEFRSGLRGVSKTSGDFYRKCLTKVSDGGLNISKEIARLALPVSTYTRFYAKTDINNFLKFVNLRDKSNAQYEIQLYASAAKELVKPLFPKVFEAWEEIVYGGVRLTLSERNLLYKLISGISFLESEEDSKLLSKIKKKLYVE